MTASVATTWGLGVMGVAEYNLDPLLVLLPAFVFAIVLSHSVQFVSRVFEQLHKHPDMRSSSKEALAKTAVAQWRCHCHRCGRLHGAGTSRDSRYPSTGIDMHGLAAHYLSWPVTGCGSGGGDAEAEAGVLSLRSELRRTPVARARSTADTEYWLISLTLCAFVAGVYGAGRLTIGDEVGSSILWPESRFNGDAEYLNESFTLLGTDLLQVYIEGEENTMVNPSVYHAIEALDRHMYQYLPEARPAQSLVPIVKSINSVLYEGDPSYGVVPDTMQELAFNTYLFRSKGEPGDFAAYTDPEWSIGNLSIPISNHAAETVERTIQTS